MRDVVIIGGGIVGLSCAWHLLEAGRQVTIIDQGDFSDGCSFGNAGMIVPSHFTPLASPGMMAQGMRWMFKKKSPFYIRPRPDLELWQWLWQFYQASNERHVENCAPLLRDLHQESKAIYKTWNQHPDLVCELQEKGILMLYNSGKGEKHEMETAAKANALGIQANVLSAAQIQQLDPRVQFSVLGGVHYPGDATFSPDLFMNRIYHHLKKRGVEFISNTSIIALQDLGLNRGELRSEKGELFKANNIVLATGAWASSLLKSLKVRLPMQGGKGYSITIPLPEFSPGIPALLHEARVSITPMGNRLRIGGTLEIGGWDRQIKKDKINWIIESVPNYYPGLRITFPEKIWYGYRPCTTDGMPVISRLHDTSSVIVATGHSMMGISLAPATGRYVRDIVMADAKPPRILDISRFA